MPTLPTFDFDALGSRTATNVIASLVGAAFVLGVRAIWRAITRHPMRQFWDSFRTGALIMTTEYQVESADGIANGPTRPDEEADRRGIEFEGSQEQYIANTATSGFVLSYGVAMALSSLLAYLQRDLGSTVRVIGDKGHSQANEGKDLVVLGSPANNQYLPGLFEYLATDYPELRRFAWTVGNRGVSMTLPDGSVLTPTVDRVTENGTDYALVLSVTQKRTGSRLVAIAGCNMWGTEAATLFLLQREHITSLPRRARRPPHAVAFVVRAHIAGGRPDIIELLPFAGGAPYLDLRRRGKALGPTG